MSLTHCPNCSRRCFTDAASCPNCLQSFRPGLLQASAVAEEKAFEKTNALFFSLFVIWVAVLMFFQLQAYLVRTGN